MGRSVMAAVFVGLPREELSEEQLEMVDDGTLECCSPFYDGGSDDGAIVGFALASTERYTPQEFAFDAQKAEELKAEFKKLTGLDARVWLSPLAW
jgi:hypothetical protein